MMFVVGRSVGQGAAQIPDRRRRADHRALDVRPDHCVWRSRLSGSSRGRGCCSASGLPLIFLPIITASYDGIPPNKTDQASALINAARNTGGSIGISLVSNVLAHREQFHQSRLVEHAIPSSVQYQDTLQQVTNYFAAQGSSLVQAQQQAIAWIGQQVQTQASFLAYMDAFWVLMLISLAAVPLALTLRKVKLGGAVPAGH